MVRVRLNQTTISGYVPRDPFVNKDKTFLSFTVGIDKSYMNHSGQWVNQTAWVPIKLFVSQNNSNRIDNILSRVKQGSYVVVVGTLDQSSYKNKHDETVNDVFVRATSIQVYSSADEMKNSYNGGNSSQNNNGSGYANNVPNNYNNSNGYGSSNNNGASQNNYAPQQDPYSGNDNPYENYNDSNVMDGIDGEGYNFEFLNNENTY